MANMEYAEELPGLEDEEPSPQMTLSESYGTAACPIDMPCELALRDYFEVLMLGHPRYRNGLYIYPDESIAAFVVRLLNVNHYKMTGLLEILQDAHIPEPQVAKFFDDIGVAYAMLLNNPLLVRHLPHTRDNVLGVINGIRMWGYKYAGDESIKYLTDVLTTFSDAERDAEREVLRQKCYLLHLMRRVKQDDDPPRKKSGPPLNALRSVGCGNQRKICAYLGTVSQAPRIERALNSLREIAEGQWRGLLDE